MLSVFANGRSQQKVLRFLGSRAIPTRCTTLLYVARDADAGFPINLLRNLAIFNIQTTHFMMLDIDLSIPCGFSVSTIHRRQPLQRDREAAALGDLRSQSGRHPAGLLL